MAISRSASLWLIITLSLLMLPETSTAALMINGTNPPCEFLSPSICSQTCGIASVCSTFSCMSPQGCNQTADNSTYIPNVLCASEDCVQDMNYTMVDKMHAVAFRVSQKYINPYSRLGEMRCIGHNGTSINVTAGNIALIGSDYKGITINNTKNITAEDITAKQTCNWCGNMSCEARNCTMDCTECNSISCSGNNTCTAACRKRCNNVACNSETCNMICLPDSQCPSVECGNKTNQCNLDCQDRATCDLNCTSAANCLHTCAKSGLCYTRIGQFVDLHNGHCQSCNCSKDIRSCVQRCEDSRRRCLELYCDASHECDQYSSSIAKSFVYRMKSYAPNGKQTCDSGSACWQMLCYGSNCNLTCTGGSICDFMICKAKSCTFNCQNGAICDVLTCLEGSETCTYKCDASSKCKNKRCKGLHCLGAKKYVESSSQVVELSRFITLASLLITFIVY